MNATNEIQAILTDAINRSSSHNTIVSIGVACDISELMAEINALLEDGQDADYARENDGRYDVWGYDEDATEGEMLWRLTVRCGDSE